MKTTNHIPDTLVEGLEGITQAKCGKAICKGCIYLAITAIIAVLMFTLNLEKGAWGEMCLGCLGVITLVMALVAIFGSKPQLRMNGIKLNGYEIYFKNPSIADITRMLEARDADGLRNAMNDTDNGLRMNVVVSEDGSVMQYRMYKYVPFEYKPEGEIVNIDAETAKFITEL